MKWALVIWLASSGSDNFSVYERFVTLEECLDKKQTVTKALNQTNSDKKQTVTKALNQTNSNMRVVCRPIEKGGQKENKTVIVQRYILY